MTLEEAFQNQDTQSPLFDSSQLSNNGLQGTRIFRHRSRYAPGRQRYDLRCQAFSATHKFLTLTVPAWHLLCVGALTRRVACPDGVNTATNAACCDLFAVRDESDADVESLDTAGCGWRGCSRRRRARFPRSQ